MALICENWGVEAALSSVSRWSAEVAQATVRGNAKLDPARAFDYRLTGTIVTSEPGDTFEFDKESRLEPVPGLPGEFR